MDHSHLSSYLHALDIILGYFNRGNSAHEITYISSLAKAWCQQHQHSLLDYTPASLDEVLWTHPFLFDLSKRSFDRLSFNDCGTNTRTNPFTRNNFGRNTMPRQTHTTISSLSHFRPFITAQHFFSAIIDAYTLYVGGNSRSFHDHIVAQDLKTSPIIHYIPEIIHRIAALNGREPLPSEFSASRPKTSLGFSSHSAKAVDIIMMDAPPINDIENDTLADFMDIDRVSTRSSKRKSAPKGINKQRSCRSRRHPCGVRKKRKKRH
ncbi:hypothetical protein V8C42DRAFT_362523 [Trichoderma barbatum]